MRTQTLVLLPGLFLIILFNLSPCFAEDGEGLSIGIDYPFTGAAAPWAEYGRMGLELALEDINRSGGVRGKPVELIFEDSQTTATGTVSAFQRLVQIKKVRAVIGSTWAFMTNPIIPIADKAHVVLISPTVMPHSVDHNSKYYFSIAHSMESMRSPVDQFFKLNPGVRRISIFCWDDAWGRPHVPFWQAIAEANGVKVEDIDCQADFGNDYRRETARTVAKAPDGVITAWYSDIVRRRFRESRISPLLLTTSDLVEALNIRNNDPALLEGVYATYWVPSDEFVTRFRKRYGREPLLEAHNHYEALRAIAKAFEADYEHPELGMRKVKYDGVQGKIDFTESNFGNQGWGVLVQVRNGKVEVANVERR